MGKACSKLLTSGGNAAPARRKSAASSAATAQTGASQRTPGKNEEGSAAEAAANAADLAAGDGADAVHVLTVEERVAPVQLVSDAPAAGDVDLSGETAPQDDTALAARPAESGENISVTTVGGKDGAAPVAVIRQEKVVVEEGDTGEGVMKVSVSEAIISADMPGLPPTVEGVNPEDLELLRKAHEHVKNQREEAEGPVVVDVTDEKPPAPPPQVAGESQSASKAAGAGGEAQKAAAYGYLLYSSRDGGCLFLLWSQESLDSRPDGADADQTVLLSFVPAPQKPVPKTKFTLHHGKTVFLTEIETKWDVWKKLERQRYYTVWKQVLKTCADYDAAVTLQEWSTKWPPPVRIPLLHVGPKGTTTVMLRPGRPVNLNAFTYVGVIPKDGANTFRAANITSEKKFVDSATQAGGTSLHLIQRGSAGTLAQEDLLNWLKEDGIEVPSVKDGGTSAAKTTETSAAQ